MKHRNLWILAVLWAMAASLAAFVFADGRGNVYSLGLELEKRAVELSESNFEHFKGWNGEVSDKEQAVLFKSESFLASCRLFLRLAEERSDYFRPATWDEPLQRLHPPGPFLPGPRRRDEKGRHPAVRPFRLPEDP